MKIYRVINKDGRGFYRSFSDTPPIQHWFPICKCLKGDRAIDMFLDSVHPWVDIKPEYKEYNFAFKSIEDLLSWFPPAILNHMNGNIICMEIDETQVVYHNKQIQYNPDAVKSTVVIDKTQFYDKTSYPTSRWWIWK